MFLLALPAAAVAQDDPVMTAVANKDLAAVQKLFREGRSANATDMAGRTALMKAIFNEDTAMVRELLNAGASVNLIDSLGNTALNYAAVMGQVETVRELARRGAALDTANRLGETALLRAAAQNNEAVVELLLELGANPNIADWEGYTPLMAAATAASTSTVKRFLDKGAALNVKAKSGETALAFAAANGSEENVRLLIDRGADINVRDRQNYTPLALTIHRCRTKLALFLLAKGVVPSVEPVFDPLLYQAYHNNLRGLPEALIAKGVKVNSPSLRGESPLGLAIRRGDTAFIAKLLAAKADPNLGDRDHPAPLLALKYNRPDIAMTLLAAGAAINVVANDGETFLSLAAALDNAALVDIALATGAAVNANDRNGKTALDKAKSVTVRRILQARGARTGDRVPFSRPVNKKLPPNFMGNAP